MGLVLLPQTLKASVIYRVCAVAAAHTFIYFMHLIVFMCRRRNISCLHLQRASVHGWAASI